MRGEEKEVRCHKTETGRKTKESDGCLNKDRNIMQEQQNSRLSCLTYKKHILEVYNNSLSINVQRLEKDLSIFMSKSLSHLTDGSFQDQNIIVV